MKTVLQNLKNWVRITGIIAVPVLILSSCSKENKSTITPQSDALMSVVDASPDAPALDFYLGITRVNSSALTLGGGIDYFVVNSGNLVTSFYNDGTSTKLVSDTINLKTNYQYTFFIANSILKPDFLLLTDSIGTIPASMAGIRLVNVSPDAGAVDIGINGQAAFSNSVNYKGSSGYIPLTFASNDTLKIFKAGTTTILATVINSGIQNGAAYTIWLYGFANTTVNGEGLNAGVMQDGTINN